MITYLARIISERYVKMLNEVNKMMSEVVGMEELKDALLGFAKQFFFAHDACGEPYDGSTISKPVIIFAGNPGVGKTSMGHIVHSKYAHFI